MSESVKQLHRQAFGELHDFHVERTAVWIDAACQELGDEVLDVIKEQGADTYGLYRWHVERTISWIDALINAYGPKAMEIIVSKHRQDRYEQGFRLAQELGTNNLEDIIPYFTHGNDENIIGKDSKHVLVRATGCLAGKIARDINRGEMIYALHCNLDRDFVRGFSKNLECEVVQTLIGGHDCCIHRLYVLEG